MSDEFNGAADVDVRINATNELRMTAVFSRCGAYRFALGRMWTPLEQHDITKVLVVIGLNPSTATEIEDDPTIRRCVGFAKAWGHHGLTMLNLFAYRATDPKDMLHAHAEGIDIFGGMGQATALDVFTRDRRVLCAWGAGGKILNRGAEMLQVLRVRQLVHLGLTKDGYPRHPLYVRGDTAPVAF